MPTNLDARAHGRSAREARSVSPLNAQDPRKEDMFDLIGDIHGHADELEQLLLRLDYEPRDGIFHHPDRKVIFLGDFIDRGPQIRRVLDIVRPMVESGNALAVMGNHELNALAFHTPDHNAPGKFLRRHSASNIKQHKATLDQLPPDLLRSHLDWFRSLPMWLELDGLRAVHACWDESAMAQVAEALALHGGVTPEFLHGACLDHGSHFTAVEVVLKGKVGDLPNGIYFEDKDGHVRTEFRTRWYLAPEGHTYRTYALQADPIACDLDLDRRVIAQAAPYPAHGKPVFFGHYWLSAQSPSVLAHNVACLDFSVAKGGFLCAYRWDSEPQLNNQNFVWISKTIA